MDILRCVDPGRVLRESLKGDGLDTLLNAKRYDGLDFPQDAAANLPKDVARTKGGWKKTKDGKVEGVQFVREDHVAPVEAKLQRYDWDGEPNGQVALAGFRSRQLLKKPLVGGDTALTDACALQETLTVCFENEVTFSFVAIEGANAESSEVKTTAVRNVHLVGFSFGQKKFAPVAGEELLYALKVSRHNLYTQMQKELNMSMIKRDMDEVRAAMKEDASEEEKIQAEHGVGRCHDKLIIVGAMETHPFEQAKTIEEHGDCCFDEMRTQSLNFLLLRASALCASQCMTERLLLALLDGMWTPANGGKILSKQMLHPVLFFTNGPVDVVLDAIAHGFVETPSDPSAGEGEARPISYIPYGTFENKELMARKQLFSEAIMRFLQTTNVGRQIKYSNSMEQQRSIWTMALQLGSMTLGDDAVAELAAKCGGEDNAMPGVTPSLKTALLLMSVQKWISCQVFEERTGQNVTDKEMMKEVLKEMKLVPDGVSDAKVAEPAGSTQRSKEMPSRLTEQTKEEASEWAADIESKTNAGS